MTMQANIPKDWKTVLSPHLDIEKLQQLSSFLESERYAGKIIYPKQEDIFNALNFTPLEQVKAVILGQDPYHGAGQAHGLSFSVLESIKIPPSLRNIYKELAEDIDFDIPTHGNLQKWAEQGVLLLNSVLTVEASKANSHRKKGWEDFTDAVIRVVNDECKNIVFLLWGSPAQKKTKFVDRKKHLVLEAPHPSPLSAYRGFFGCKHFSKANEYLEKNGRNTIDWQIDSTNDDKQGVLL